MQFSLSLVFPLFMIAEFLVDLKNPHVTFRVQNARSFAPIDTRTPLHAESGDAVHCRLFRPAYGRFATCKKEKKSPLARSQLNLVLAGVLRTRQGVEKGEGEREVVETYVCVRDTFWMFMPASKSPTSRYHFSTHRPEIEFRFATRITCVYTVLV